MSGAARCDVVITATGVISSLGDAPGQLYHALCRGDSGLRPLALADGEEAALLAGRPAGQIADFRPDVYMGARNFRPLDRTGQLTTAAAQLALAAGGWTPERLAEHEVGLVLGTMFGSVHTISAFDRRALELGPQYAKPLDFANTVINAAAGQAAIWHNLRGINSTVCGGSSSGLQALAYATDQIRAGRAAALLAGGAEELCFESFYGFLRAGLLCGGLSPNGDAPAPRPLPFDARRNGFAPGEGAALLMLEQAAAARARGARILAEVRGLGNSYDPSRGRDDDEAASALARAVRAALAEAGLQPQQLDALSVSASGSPTGDRHEALGLARALGPEVAATVPVCAVKAMLGEALGASGALQALVLVEAMAGGVLPGIPGLEPEPDLPLGRLSAASQPLELRHGLVTALGLDGNACALVLARPAAVDGG